MTIIQDSTTIITGTGTIGDTITIGDGINTGITTMDIIITVSIIIAVVIAHLLDRKLNRETYHNQEQSQELYLNRWKNNKE
jgi:phage-related holin